VSSEQHALPIRVGHRLVTTALTVVALEVAGMGLYMAVLKPRVLSALLAGPSTFRLKMIASSNADLLFVPVLLLIVGLGYAVRSDTSRATGDVDQSSSVAADTGGSPKSDTDETGDFAGDTGEFEGFGADE
jgi:hypothetical protein